MAYSYSIRLRPIGSEEGEQTLFLYFSFQSDLSVNNYLSSTSLPMGAKINYVG